MPYFNNIICELYTHEQYEKYKTIKLEKQWKCMSMVMLLYTVLSTMLLKKCISANEGSYSNAVARNIQIEVELFSLMC